MQGIRPVVLDNAAMIQVPVHLPTNPKAAGPMCLGDTLCMTVQPKLAAKAARKTGEMNG